MTATQDSTEKRPGWEKRQANREQRSYEMGYREAQRELRDTGKHSYDPAVSNVDSPWGRGYIQALVDADVLDGGGE